MSDEYLTQARQALADGDWDQARRLYETLSSGSRTEAELALKLISLQQANASKEHRLAEQMAREADEGPLNLGDLPEYYFSFGFARALQKSILSILDFSKGSKCGIELHICTQQENVAEVVRNILLDYCFADEVSRLPESEQRKYCQTIVDLDKYIRFRRSRQKGYDIKMHEVFRALNIDDPRLQRGILSEQVKEQDLTEPELKKYTEDKKNASAALIVLLVLFYMVIKIVIVSTGDFEWFGELEIIFAILVLFAYNMGSARNKTSPKKKRSFRGGQPEDLEESEQPEDSQER